MKTETTPDKNPSAWRKASTAPTDCKRALGAYLGVHGPTLGFIANKRFYPDGGSGSEPITHFMEIPILHPDQPTAPASVPEATPPPEVNPFVKAQLHAYERVSADPVIQRWTTPQPGPTPETDATTGNSFPQDAQIVPADFARRLERERDEARRERDRLLDSGAAHADFMRLSKQHNALRQDRDGLAALCEKLRMALEGTNTTLMQVSSELVSTKDGPIGIFLSESYRIQDENRKLLALTPASALARQREKEKAT